MTFVLENAHVQDPVPKEISLVVSLAKVFALYALAVVPTTNHNVSSAYTAALAFRPEMFLLESGWPLDTWYAYTVDPIQNQSVLPLDTAALGREED